MDDDGRRQTPGYAQERSWSIRSLVIWGGVGGTKREVGPEKGDQWRDTKVIPAVLSRKI